MTEAITQILYPIVEWCHTLTGNWWIAILLFTVITKVLLMPLSLWSHRNSITMVELMPDLFGIKTSFYGDRETIEEKQSELYKERHYHPMLSLVPLAVQIIILFGLSGVIRTIVNSGDPDVALLGIVPTETGLPYLPVVPLLAGLSSLVQGLAANHINPLQREQSTAEKATTNGISISLSLFLAAFVTCGMAFYWVCSNLMAIVVQLACNTIIKPAKNVDYEALSAARSDYEALESSTAPQRKWYQRDPHAGRERRDYQRFLAIEGKHLVFYSEGSGFYKYFKGAIEWLLNNSDIQIHYITNDPNDQVFGIAENEPRLLPYYIGQRRLITLMMKMDADVVAMSTPELDNAYIKRSYVRRDTTYVYMPHHTTSFHLTGTKHGYDHFDEVFCVGPHQAAELAKMEELYDEPAKKLPLIGYDLIDEEIRAYAEGEHEAMHVQPVVLVAPSWNPGNILDSCIDEMLEVLLAHGYRVIVRPHPEYTKRFRPKWEALMGRFAHIPEDQLYFEKDFSSNSSILESDTIITDWSTVNLEFSFTTLKPSIFIDTPMKVNNPDWEELGIVPTDISIRNEIGKSVSPDALSELPGIIDDMLFDSANWSGRIEEVRSRMIANLGHGAEKAGERLLELVLEHQTMEKVYGSPVREAAKTPSPVKEAPAHSGEEPAHLMEEPAPTEEPHHLEEEPAHLEAVPEHEEGEPAHLIEEDSSHLEESAHLEEPAHLEETPAHLEEPLPAHSPEAIAEAIAEAESAGEELPADDVVALVRVEEPSTQALMIPKHAAPEAKHLSAGDVGCVLLAVLVSTLLVPRPALAYVDPSVMTYAIQALAAVAVALSAVLGVAFRRTRSVIFKLLRIDEKSGDLSEPPVHRIDPNQKDEIDWEVREGRKTREIERKKRQVRVAWPIRLLLSALAVGLIAFTVFMVAPIELVASNSSSLVYGVDMVWKPLAVRAAIITGVGALVLSLFRGKPFHFLLALVTALGVAAYLEAFIFARYLPIADGTPVNWSAFGVVTALSIALWVAVIVGAIVFSFRKPPVARTIGAIAAVILIIMQSAGIASLSGITGAGEDVIREDEGPEITAENYQNVCTELGLFDVSSQNNVIVFVLDMSDSAHIRYLLDGYHPNILDGLDGFTFYENSGGGMIPTRYGIPLLLTGSLPREGELMFDYVNNRYNRSSFLSDISELGYSIGLYTTSLGMNDEEAFIPASYSFNNHDVTESMEVFSASFNEEGAVRVLYQCALYRHLPWALKPSFWYYTDDINQGMANTSTEQLEGDETLYQTDDVVYYQKLKARGLTFNEEPASFRFIHLNGNHWPYTMNRYGQRISKGQEYCYEQCIGSFAIVKTYLNELKRLGVYDQTTIIITADHGMWHPIDSDEYEPIDEPTSPIIFVKPAQTHEEASQPCQISQAPVTIIDLMPTILEAMGADEEMLSAYGPDIYYWQEGDERVRYFYMLDRAVKEDGTFGQDEGLWEYAIDGDVSDFDNWEFTGNVNMRSDNYYQDRGIL